MSRQISENQNSDAELLHLINLLYQQLKNAKGKKVYGYLKQDTKKTVDLIFSRLAQNETIAQMYALWCEMEQAKHDVYSSAKVDFPELIDNLEFKSVKNMIVKTVANMNLNPTESEQENFDFQGEFISTDEHHHTEQYQNRMLAETAFRLLANLSKMIEEDYDSTERTLHSQTDSKLRRIIQKKKQELGIRSSDS